MKLESKTYKELLQVAKENGLALGAEARRNKAALITHLRAHLPQKKAQPEVKVKVKAKKPAAQAKGELVKASKSKPISKELKELGSAARSELADCLEATGRGHNIRTDASEGMTVREFWGYLFFLNELYAQRGFHKLVLTDEQISLQMRSVFQRNSAVFDQVQMVRGRFNRGVLLGKQPGRFSYRYVRDEEGTLVRKASRAAHKDD